MGLLLDITRAPAFYSTPEKSHGGKVDGIAVTITAVDSQPHGGGSTPRHTHTHTYTHLHTHRMDGRGGYIT